MPRTRLRSVPICLTLALLPATALQAMQPGSAGDSWRVRATGRGAARSVQSFSDINVDGGVRRVPLASVPVSRKVLQGHVVELQADTTAHALLSARGIDYRPELDKALAWLRQLAPTRTPLRLRVTLVGDGLHAQSRSRHDGARETAIDFLAPLRHPRAAGTSISAQVGQALAIGLHEASHASADGFRKLSRHDDEYRATLVESCYLIDTLRPGDRIRLEAGDGARSGDDFAGGASRNAARDAIGDLIRAAGSAQVAANDRVAMLGLKALCRVNLAMPLAAG